MTARVFADFHDLDDENRLRLTCNGTREDLARLGIQLRDGLELTLYTDDVNDNGDSDDLMVDGIVQFDQNNQVWVASVDWNALRHSSDLKPDNGATDARVRSAVNKKTAI